MNTTGIRAAENAHSNAEAAPSDACPLDARLLAHLKTLPRNRRPNMHAVKEALGAERVAHVLASMDRLYARELIDRRGLPVPART